MADGKAVAALVLGICSIVLMWVPFLNFILAVLAIIFGIISVKGAGEDDQKKGFGIAGIIMGGVSILIGVFLTLTVFMAMFGVLDAGSMVPEVTSFSAPVQNIDNAVYDGSTITVAFVNNRGSAITIPGTASATGDCQGLSYQSGKLSDGTPLTAQTQIPNGENFILTFSCPGGKEQINTAIDFEYVDTFNGLERTHSGVVRARLV